MTDHLSPAELEALTGYRRPSAQRRVLESWGVRPWTNGRGEIIVMRAVLAQVQASPRPVRRGPAPNLKAVR